MFEEDHGLRLRPEVVKALGLVTTVAENRPLMATAKVMAQVFAVKPSMLASASVPESEAAHLENHVFDGAKLVRIERGAARATRLVDLIFELNAGTPRQVGEFVTIAMNADPTTALAIPAGALLETAAGTFVYVASGEHYLRTPVKIGLRGSDIVEISDGLHAGDVVVQSPVNQLWLAERRLTHGGGHSH